MRHVPRPSPAMLVALAALAVALGGTAVAAVVIDGSSIRNRSVGAAKIKRNALTGVEINEARLTRVPSALRADVAGRADTATSATSAIRADVATTAGTAQSANDAAALGGVAPGGFVQGTAKYVAGVRQVADGAANATVLTVPGVATVLADCAPSGLTATVKVRNDTTGTLIVEGATIVSDDTVAYEPENPALAAGATQTLAAWNIATRRITIFSATTGLSADLNVTNRLCQIQASGISNR